MITVIDDIYEYLVMLYPAVANASSVFQFFLNKILNWYDELICNGL